MLTEALSFEDIKVMPSLQEFLRMVGKSKLDEIVKLEAEEKVRHLLEETIWHSRMFTEMIKEVARSDREEY